MRTHEKRFPRLFGALLLALCLALFAVPAMAQMGGGMMGGGPGYGHGYGQGYGPGYGQGQSGWGEPFTAEQQAAYWEVARKYSQKQSDLYSKLWPLQTEMNTALSAEKPDSSKVRKLAGQIGDLMGEMYKMRMDFLLELRDRGLPAYTMMGPGMMGPGMMGYGGYGMMGPGMMGYGGYGMMGPGMMGGWQ